MALAVLLGVTLAPPVSMLEQLILNRFALSEHELLLRALMTRSSTSAGAVLMVVMSVCVGPLVAELFFRGALFSALHRSRGLSAAAAVSIVACALFGLDARAVPGLILLGSAQALLRIVSGSLVPCIALHVAFGATFALGRLWGVVDVMGHLKLPALVAAGAWVAAALLAHAISSVGRSSEDAERARAEDAS
jgi:membrane protease YdiL (CAAX protease family)